MSDFWSVYIIAIVVLNLVGCAFLLFANLRMTPEQITQAEVLVGDYKVWMYPFR